MILFGFQSIYVMCVCYTIVSDFRHLIIPNWIILLLICTFAAFATTYLEPRVALDHIILAVFILFLACVFFVVNWIGGGDVKFMTATILWIGPEHAPHFTVLMAALGSAFALAMIGIKKYPYLVDAYLPDNWVLRRITALAEEGQVPYGVAIGMAAILTPNSLLMRGAGS